MKAPGTDQNAVNQSKILRELKQVVVMVEVRQAAADELDHQRRTAHHHTVLRKY